MSGAGVSLETGCPLWEDNTEDGQPGVQQAPLATARPSPSCVPPCPRLPVGLTAAFVAGRGVRNPVLIKLLPSCSTLCALPENAGG